MQPLFGAEASAALLRSPEEISDPVELLGPSGIESWAVEIGSASQQELECPEKNGAAVPVHCLQVLLA